MRQIALRILLVTALTSTAVAGQLYGTIFENNQPMQNIPLVLTCPGAEPVKGNTDNEGIFRLFARGTGTCTLTLQPDGRNAQGTLYSYDRPTSYDFDVVNQSGRWTLVPRSSRGSDAGR